MCEKYDYGFIEMKSILPKPAVYVSYLLQLLLNIKCSVQKEIYIQGVPVDAKVAPFYGK